MARQAPGILLLASVLFFLSGALGLGYQLVWVKKAALIVGASQIALSTVVTSFFLGLALGSLFVGRHLRSRRWSPLVVYGLFEIAIGLFALAFPALFRGVEHLYGIAYPIFQASAPALFAMRFGLLFILFLLPTFFMGGTLPLLLDGLVDRDKSVGSLTSYLYGLNTAGAVAGVLATGYFAVPALGMNGTSVAAGIGNLTIGLVALLRFARTPPLHPAEPGTKATRTDRLYVAMAFASGFAALGYQMAWARYFSLFNPASVYFTAVFLAVFLMALAAGSMALVPILQRMAPLRIVALSQPFVPALVFGCLGGWRLAFHDFDKVGDPELLAVAPTWALWSEYTDAIFLSPLIQIGLVLFVPVLLLGTGLPALIAAATRTSESLRAHSGSLVFWNTVGGSVGSFAGGYLLLPALGLTRTLLALGAVSLSLGLTAAWRESAERRSEGDGSRTAATRLVPAAILAALVAAFCLNAARTDVTEATITRYGQANPNAEMRLVDLVEGPLTTAYILEDAAGGKFIGSGDVILAGAQNATFSFQNLEGAIPALFYPRPGTPKRVLGIALGSGQSFGTLLLHPIEHMDVVDISTEIVSLSLAYFSSYQNGLGRDPRVAFHLDDGRHFIARQPAGSYDVVTTEPPPPTDEGVFALYSYEFCQEVDRVLRDGGVLINWLPLYRVTPGDVRAIVKTQAAVFPHTFLIRTAASDYGVVSFKTEEPPLFKKEWLRERIAHFSEERHMKTFRWPGTVYPLASLEGITALVMTGPEDVARMPEVPLNLEDRQQLSYTSGDRQLLRKFEEPRIIERLAFTALPITPFSELQRYFDYSLPVAELERDRVAPMAERFRAPDPGRIARQRARYESSALPAAKAEAAVAIAALHDLTLAKGPALEWLARALDHGASTKSQAGVARKIARHGAAVYASEVEAWIEALPEPQQRSPLVATMREELDAFRTWDRETRLDRYWFE